VQRAILAVSPKTRQAVREVTESSARLITADAVQNAPVDTGKLRQSISFELLDNGLSAHMFVVVPYGWIVEFGTGGLVQIPEGFSELAGQFRGKGIRTINRPPQPYMIPAFLKYRDKHVAEVRARIRSFLR
jgi:HK97 gp10 family phage protein